MAHETERVGKSDTVSVTPDGRVIVDVHKLFLKESMKETLRAIRVKTSSTVARERKSA
jgi:hypothetical protein